MWIIQDESTVFRNDFGRVPGSSYLECSPISVQGIQRSPCNSTCNNGNRNQKCFFAGMEFPQTLDRTAGHVTGVTGTPTNDQVTGSTVTWTRFHMNTRKYYDKLDIREVKCFPLNRPPDEILVDLPLSLCSCCHLVMSIPLSSWSSPNKGIFGLSFPPDWHSGQQTELLWVKRQLYLADLYFPFH